VIVLNAVILIFSKMINVFGNIFTKFEIIPLYFYGKNDLLTIVEIKIKHLSLLQIAKKDSKYFENVIMYGKWFRKHYLAGGCCGSVVGLTNVF